MTEHEQLCERARRWLSGTRRCKPVFSNCASCAEIPDAIGWSSCHQWCGSTVVECKTSVNDFYADRRKRFQWERISNAPGYRFKATRMTAKYAKENGYQVVEVPLMGDYRFYFCLPNVLTADLIAEHTPDHGLIWWEGRTIKVMKPAPKRERVDKDSEIRFLRFAIINAKNPFEGVPDAIESAVLL